MQGKSGTKGRHAVNSSGRCHTRPHRERARDLGSWSKTAGQRWAMGEEIFPGRNRRHGMLVMGGTGVKSVWGGGGSRGEVESQGEERAKVQDAVYSCSDIYWRLCARD